MLPLTPRDRRIDAALWSLTCICAGATLWFSFGPYVPGTHLFPGADKVEHMLAYGSTLLSFMLAADWRPGRGDGSFPRSARSVAILAVLLGIVIEWLQGRYFHRMPEVLDVLAEAVGSLGAFGLFSLVRDRLGSGRERASART